MSPHAAQPPESAQPDRILDAIGRRLDEAVLVVSRDHCVRFLNPAARSLLDLDDSVLGRRLEDTVGDYRLALMVGACLAEGEEVVRELADLSRDRHIVARALPIRDPGAGGVVLVLRDDSRVRRLETVRRDFVANVSHELRTPIAAIQLLVETLQGGALSEAEIALDFVNKIGLEVAHMAQMVSELLELSTIESGQRPARFVATPVEDLFEAADRLVPLAEQRGVAIHHLQEPGMPDLLGDPASLEQVVRNLVHNAIKFTPAGGSVRLSARLDPGPPARVELRVTDTGCGIPPDEVTRIFERFYKADKSRQRAGEGTGLGLAIARHTVEAHNGSITVESTVGRGSTFVVRIPPAPAADLDAAPA